MGGKGGGGGGGTVPQNIPPELVAAQHDLIRQMTASGGQADNREQAIFNQLMSAGGRARAWEDLFRTKASDVNQLIHAQARSADVEGIVRGQTERALLNKVQDIAPQFRNMGVQAEGSGLGYAGQMAGISPQFRTQFSAPAQSISNSMMNTANQGQQLSFANQMAGGVPVQHMNLLSNASLQQGYDTVNQSNRLGQLGNMIGTELGPLRGQSLGTLNQVAQGQVPTAVQNLFTDAGGARERDVLELQSQAARNRMIEDAGAQGGGLQRNLGALDTNRMLGLAGQEARRTDQQRALSRDLFGMATEQGLTSPQQQAQFLGQSGQLIQGAEGLRQARHGLAGQLYGQGEQMRQGALGAAGGLYGQAEQQRQAGLMGAGGVLGQSEQFRQSGLQNSLGALDTAANRDLQARMANAQLLGQSQTLYQNLAAQYGAGGDQLRLASPNMYGQALSAMQGAVMAPGMSAGIYQGAPITPASSYYGPAMGGMNSIIDAQMQSQMAQQQMRSQNNAGLMNLVGTLGGGALMAFT